MCLQSSCNRKLIKMALNRNLFYDFRLHHHLPLSISRNFTLTHTHLFSIHKNHFLTLEKNIEAKEDVQRKANQIWNQCKLASSISYITAYKSQATFKLCNFPFFLFCSRMFFLTFCTNEVEKLLNSCEFVFDNFYLLPSNIYFFLWIFFHLIFKMSNKFFSLSFHSLVITLC